MADSSKSDHHDNATTADSDSNGIVKTITKRIHHGTNRMNGESQRRSKSLQVRDAPGAAFAEREMFSDVNFRHPEMTMQHDDDTEFGERRMRAAD